MKERLNELSMTKTLNLYDSTNFYSNHAKVSYHNKNANKAKSAYLLSRTVQNKLALWLFYEHF